MKTMYTFMRPFCCLLLGMAMLASCQSDKSSKASASEDAGTTEEVKYPITAFPSSPQFPSAKIEDMRYKDGTFDFDIVAENYQLGEQTSDAETKMCANSGKGQHIHLIIDELPYAAKYEASFAHEVANGQHNLLAFLSRSYHESIKSPGAAVAAQVTVQDGTITASEEIVEPTLFYSRPKGTYVGDDTKKIMVDFYPLNADIGGAHRIKLQVNGEVTLLDKWQPHFIEGLPYGENTIGVALVYADGTEVEGRQTAVLQKITLREDPLPQ